MQSIQQAIDERRAAKGDGSDDESSVMEWNDQKGVKVIASTF